MLDDGEVRTPPGFKDAYQQYIDGGWPSLDQPSRYGGQDLPMSLGTAVREMNGTANWSWAMYPGLSHGAMETIDRHGSDEQKAMFMEPLVSGRWTGTMCLTEPHCGTDLGLLKTRAEPAADGTYRITGTKLFVSSGEHDLTENIVHIVLARLPGAPAGTHGISLFIVPKFIPKDDGSVGERNPVKCGALEHKMGIHGNATCLLNFDGATGYLVGEENKGLSYMFTFMNFARLGTGLQGLAHSEIAFQNSLAYARERLQMRSLSGPKNPDGPADPIIVHPDVRRMLLTQKAFVEGGRVLCFLTGREIDSSHLNPDPTKRQQSEDLIAFLTPIVKAFLTDASVEVTSLAVQIHGGHGYIREAGVEQLLRDARITPIYEGTNGIQAMDLLGRKVLGTGGKSQQAVAALFRKTIDRLADVPETAAMAKALGERVSQWDALTLDLCKNAMKGPDEVAAAANDYLQFSGYVCLGWCLLAAAGVAARRLGEGVPDPDFYRAKLVTAAHYFDRILPRAEAHAAAARAGAEGLMSLSDEQLYFA
jgi:hypothetical protein